MIDKPRIVLDAMGGDRMPAAALDGAVAAAGSGAEVVLVGDRTALEAGLTERGADLEVRHAADVISMDDHASDVRRRRESSVMVAMAMVADGEADACVSLGHSGATMAAALLRLGRIDGVERPALLANIPTDNGWVALLDVGANADCKPVYLQQFAVMGHAYARAFHDREPHVGLMSIGEEPHKGNELTREAHALLAATPGIDFYGNIEGRDLLEGVTEVVVTDGFTGNVILKLAEGEARTLFGWIRTALRATLMGRLGGALIRPALRGVAARLDPGTYGATPLLGVDGYAFIGHGSADARSVEAAIRTARRAVEADLLGAIRDGVARIGANGAAVGS
jgi:glycerol-3-phosphate acyltransferase PlsX